MRLLSTLFVIFLWTNISFAQCTLFDATSCMCSDSVSTNCDLLPDIKVALPPLYVQGSSGIIEYSQSGNGTNNGRLRVSVSTPNIGFGPLTVRTTTTYLCGTDTFYNTAPSQCPNGDPPRTLVNQRVYHKNGNTMSFYDRPAGSMTYHPSHGHMHVDDWGIYTLRDSTPGEADPTNWPIIGTGSKLAFCLMDYGTCSFYAGHCADDNGNTLLNGDFANYGLGGGSYNCSATEQGITSGYTDIYYQYLDGMWLNIPPGTCNGDYYIVVELDPYDYFLESNENNNVVAVPYTLTQQMPSGSAPLVNTLGTSTICQGNSVDLAASLGSTYLWSNGDTTQNITVTQTGDYYVTVSSNCGTGTSDTISITVVDPQVTSSVGDTISPGQSAELLANSNIGSIKWYNDPIGGTMLFEGNSYTSGTLNNSTTFYAEAVFNSQSATQFSAPHSNIIGNGAQHNVNSRYLTFDCHTPINLK
ncbi:MAG: hypothetical protein HKN22_00885, partial [Bacteroidia bacterium]|nr:hypothetical protein [Bacteroidia bacterium]